MINIKKFVKNAIIEDNGRGDLFFDVAPKGRFTARAICKSDGILAGVQYAKVLARTEKFDCKFLKNDGDEIKEGDIIAELEGKASILLSSERTFLNMLQHASGIATMANKYAKLIEGTGVVLLDTRKTRPQLRDFEKYASRVGGAINHRLGLLAVVISANFLNNGLNVGSNIPMYIIAFIIIYKHIPNIIRMIKGEEKKVI